jgi:hypothetical protein
MTNPYEEFGAFCAHSQAIINDAEYYSAIEAKIKELGIGAENVRWAREKRMEENARKRRNVISKIASRRNAGEKKPMRGKNKLHPRSRTNVAIVDTEEFWQAMEKPGFIRISMTSGCCGRTRYFTDTPPEYVDGFIEGKTRAVAHILGDPPSLNSPSRVSTYLMRFWTFLCF